MVVRIQCTSAYTCKECLQARDFFASQTATEITIYGKGSTYQVFSLRASLAKVDVHVSLTSRYGEPDLTGASQDASRQGNDLAPWRLHRDLCQQPGAGIRAPGVAGIGLRSVD